MQSGGVAPSTTGEGAPNLLASDSPQHFPGPAEQRKLEFEFELSFLRVRASQNYAEAAQDYFSCLAECLTELGEVPENEKGHLVSLLEELSRKKETRFLFSPNASKRPLSSVKDERDYILAHRVAHFKEEAQSRKEALRNKRGKRRSTVSTVEYQDPFEKAAHELRELKKKGLSFPGKRITAATAIKAWEQYWQDVKNFRAQGIKRDWPTVAT